MNKIAKVSKWQQEDLNLGFLNCESGVLTIISPCFSLFSVDSLRGYTTATGNICTSFLHVFGTDKRNSVTILEPVEGR